MRGSSTLAILLVCESALGVGFSITGNMKSLKNYRKEEAYIVQAFSLGSNLFPENEASFPRIQITQAQENSDLKTNETDTIMLSDADSFQSNTEFAICYDGTEKTLLVCGDSKGGNSEFRHLYVKMHEISKSKVKGVPLVKFWILTLGEDKPGDWGTDRHFLVLTKDNTLTTDTKNKFEESYVQDIFKEKMRQELSNVDRTRETVPYNKIGFAQMQALGKTPEYNNTILPYQAV